MEGFVETLVYIRPKPTGLGDNGLKTDAGWTGQGVINLGSVLAVDSNVFFGEVAAPGGGCSFAEVEAYPNRHLSPRDAQGGTRPTALPAIP